MVTRKEWVSRGRVAIQELLAEQLAAPIAELEARIADQPWSGQPNPIHPYMLSTARRELEQEGAIQVHESRTRGGSIVPLVLPASTPHGKKRLAADAAGRKRLLFARWKSWSSGHDMPNLIGNGGEKVVHESLLAAAPIGYRVIQPTKRQVDSLFGEKIPGGSLDNAAWLTPLDHRTQAPTGSNYLVPIEVKNVRSWLYPNHHEIYQLLYKASELAACHPEHPVLPVLVCRKAPYSTRQLAKDLGFLFFETHDQYVLPSQSLNIEQLEEVRQELGFSFLNVTDQASGTLSTWLRQTVPAQAVAYSTRWMSAGPLLTEHFAAFKQRNLHWFDRLPHLQQMHQIVKTNFGVARSWASSDELHSDDG